MSSGKALTAVIFIFVWSNILNFKSITFFNKNRKLRTMKKLISLLLLGGLLSLGLSTIVIAQDEDADTNQTEAVNDSTQVQDTADTDTSAAVMEEEEAVQEMTLHKQVKQKFIEGGASFMGLVLLALIFGLAIAIERIIYLNLATTNTDKLLKNEGLNIHLDRK